MPTIPAQVIATDPSNENGYCSFKLGNFELSRDRAVSVATILQAGSANPGGINWRGVGPSEPRYGPDSGPDYRARNRRVEIIHVRGS